MHPSPSAEHNSEKPHMSYQKAECNYQNHNLAAWRIKIENVKSVENGNSVKNGKHNVENQNII